MKKAWKIVTVVVLILVLLGALSIGVGLLTGADMNQIETLLNQRPEVEGFRQVLTRGIELITGLFTA